MFNFKVRFFVTATVLLVAGLVFGCQKTEKKGSPCADLIGDIMPVSIFVKFIDKKTGENNIVANDLSSDEVTVTVGQTDKLLDATVWRIYNDGPAESPRYGAAQSGIVAMEEGKFTSSIQVRDFGIATFSYTVAKKENRDNSHCRLSRYNEITEVNIEDYNSPQSLDKFFIN